MIEFVKKSHVRESVCAIFVFLQSKYSKIQLFLHFYCLFLDYVKKKQYLCAAFYAALLRMRMRERE